MSDAPQVNVRVAIRCDTVDAFIDKCWRLVDRDRIFIFSQTPQAVGTKLRFQLVLSDGTEVLRGDGEVLRARPQGNDPSRPPGMDVLFAASDDESQRLVETLRAARAKRETGTRPAIFDDPPSRDATPLKSLAPPPPTTRPLRTPPPPPPAPMEVASLPKEAAPPQPKPAEPRKVDTSDIELAISDSAAPDAPAPTVQTAEYPLKQALAAIVTRPHSQKPWPTVKPEAAADPALQPQTADPEPTVETQTPPMEAAPEEAPDAPKPVREPSLLVLPQKVRFAEQWRRSQPRVEAVPVGVAVPANPFAEVGDDAIEFFVEWSLEQSKGSPTVESTSFAEVPMRWGDVGNRATIGNAIIPGPTPDAPFWKRGPLVIGIAAASLVIGLGVGLPLGARLLGGHPAEDPPPARLAAAATPSSLDPATAAPAPATAAPVPDKPAVEKAPSPAAAVHDAPAAGARGDVGTVEITTRPAGARVTIDDRSVGRSPITRELAAGEHRVTVDKERYVAANRSVTVAAGERATLDIGLARPTTHLSVTSQPPGAAVSIGKVASGKTPVTLEKPAFETYKLRVQMVGCAAQEKTVYLKPDAPAIAFSCPRAATAKSAPTRPAGH